MSKKFFVDRGYLALNGACWYDHRVTLIVEEDEWVEVYTAPDGRPASHIGNYECRRLDPAAPPTGLRHAR